MIIESILVVIFAIILDFIFGDPKNKFHPTSWIGTLIAKLVPFVKNESPKLEKDNADASVLIMAKSVAGSAPIKVAGRLEPSVNEAVIP